MASVITTSVDRARVRSILPEWFKTETGFRFLFGGDEAVVVGFGGWRKSEPLGSIQLNAVSGEHGHIAHGLNYTKFLPPTLVFSYLYKGEWHMASVEEVIADAERNGQSFPFTEMRERRIELE